MLTDSRMLPAPTMLGSQRPDHVSGGCNLSQSVMPYSLISRLEALHYQPPWLTYRVWMASISRTIPVLINQTNYLLTSLLRRRRPSENARTLLCLLLPHLRKGLRHLEGGEILKTFASKPNLKLKQEEKEKLDAHLTSTLSKRKRDDFAVLISSHHDWSSKEKHCLQPLTNIVNFPINT